MGRWIIRQIMHTRGGYTTITTTQNIVQMMYFFVTYCLLFISAWSVSLWVLGTITTSVCHQSPPFLKKASTRHTSWCAPVILHWTCPGLPICGTRTCASNCFVIVCQSLVHQPTFLLWLQQIRLITHMPVSHYNLHSRDLPANFLWYSIIFKLYSELTFDWILFFNDYMYICVCNYFTFDLIPFTESTHFKQFGFYYHVVYLFFWMYMWWPNSK